MTADSITPFLFEGETLIRIHNPGLTPGFMAADVCKAIGGKNPSDAVKPLDEDEKYMVPATTLGISEGGPDRIFVTESGLYTLILRSHDAIKPGTVAHRFRKWVTAEVLPTIRRTGQYQAASTEADDEDAQSPDGLKLRKVNTCVKVFGERAGAQLWHKLGLETVPAMRPILAQYDMLEETVSITTRHVNGGAH